MANKVIHNLIKKQIAITFFELFSFSNSFHIFQLHLSIRWEQANRPRLVRMGYCRDHLIMCVPINESKPKRLSSDHIN